MSPNPRNEFAAYCVELLAPLGPCTARRMFGGHGLYLDGVMIGLVAGERLYFKTDAQSLPRWREAGCEPFAFEAKGLWAWGGAVGASRGISDLEKNVAYEIASYLRNARGLALPEATN